MQTLINYYLVFAFSFVPPTDLTAVAAGTTAPLLHIIVVLLVMTLKVSIREIIRQWRYLGCAGEQATLLQAIKRLYWLRILEL